MAKKEVLEALNERTEDIELEADNVFPKEERKYLFKLRNGTIVPSVDDVEILTEKDLWDFIDLLRNEYFSNDNENEIPSVVYFKGRCIQIDNVPLAKYLAYQSGSHKSVGEIVTNVMRNERIKALYSDPDTEEEFSDFVDDTEIENLTPFERAMYQAEKEAELELFNRIQATRSSLGVKENSEAGKLNATPPQKEFSTPQASDAGGSPDSPLPEQS